jgi:hypothetical protein
VLLRILHMDIGLTAEQQAKLPGIHVVARLRGR